MFLGEGESRRHYKVKKPLKAAADHSFNNKGKGWEMSLRKEVKGLYSKANKDKVAHKAKLIVDKKGGDVCGLDSDDESISSLGGKLKKKSSCWARFGSERLFEVGGLESAMKVGLTCMSRELGPLAHEKTQYLVVGHLDPSPDNATLAEENQCQLFGHCDSGEHVDRSGDPAEDSGSEFGEGQLAVSTDDDRNALVDVSISENRSKYPSELIPI
ncbi:hypothetical protein QYF36_008000 [Acer negundo]|nr:hypothetical protein QYF36_008000 [Acer negundo]